MKQRTTRFQRQLLTYLMTFSFVFLTWPFQEILANNVEATLIDVWARMYVEKQVNAYKKHELNKGVPFTETVTKVAGHIQYQKAQSEWRAEAFEIFARDQLYRDHLDKLESKDRLTREETYERNFLLALEKRRQQNAARGVSLVDGGAPGRGSAKEHIFLSKNAEYWYPNDNSVERKVRSHIAHDLEVKVIESNSIYIGEKNKLERNVKKFTQAAKAADDLLYQTLKKEGPSINPAKIALLAGKQLAPEYLKFTTAMTAISFIQCYASTRYKGNSSGLAPFGDYSAVDPVCFDNIAAAIASPAGLAGFLAFIIGNRMFSAYAARTLLEVLRAGRNTIRYPENLARLNLVFMNAGMAIGHTLSAAVGQLIADPNIKRCAAGFTRPNGGWNSVDCQKAFVAFKDFESDFWQDTIATGIAMLTAGTLNHMSHSLVKKGLKSRAGDDFYKTYKDGIDARNEGKVAYRKFKEEVINKQYNVGKVATRIIGLSPKGLLLKVGIFAATNKGFKNLVTPTFHMFTFLAWDHILNVPLSRTYHHLHLSPKTEIPIRTTKSGVENLKKYGWKVPSQCLSHGLYDPKCNIPLPSHISDFHDANAKYRKKVDMFKFNQVMINWEVKWNNFLASYHSAKIFLESLMHFRGTKKPKKVMKNSSMPLALPFNGLADYGFGNASNQYQNFLKQTRQLARGKEAKHFYETQLMTEEIKNSSAVAESELPAARTGNLNHIKMFHRMLRPSKASSIHFAKLQQIYQLTNQVVGQHTHFGNKVVKNAQGQNIQRYVQNKECVLKSDYGKAAPSVHSAVCFVAQTNNILEAFLAQYHNKPQNQKSEHFERAARSVAISLLYLKSVKFAPFLRQLLGSKFLPQISHHLKNFEPIPQNAKDLYGVGVEGGRYTLPFMQGLAVHRFPLGGTTSVLGKLRAFDIANEFASEQSSISFSDYTIMNLLCNVNSVRGKVSPKRARTGIDLRDSFGKKSVFGFPSLVPLKEQATFYKQNCQRFNLERNSKAASFSDSLREVIVQYLPSAAHPNSWGANKIHQSFWYYKGKTYIGALELLSDPDFILSIGNQSGDVRANSFGEVRYWWQTQVIPAAFAFRGEFMKKYVQLFKDYFYQPLIHKNVGGAGALLNQLNQNKDQSGFDIYNYFNLLGMWSYSYHQNDKVFLQNLGLNNKRLEQSTLYNTALNVPEIVSKALGSSISLSKHVMAEADLYLSLAEKLVTVSAEKNQQLRQQENRILSQINQIRSTAAKLATELQFQNYAPQGVRAGFNDVMHRLGKAANSEKNSQAQLMKLVKKNINKRCGQIDPAMLPGVYKGCLQEAQQENRIIKQRFYDEFARDTAKALVYQPHVTALNKSKAAVEKLTHDIKANLRKNMLRQDQHLIQLADGPDTEALFSSLKGLDIETFSNYYRYHMIKFLLDVVYKNVIEGEIINNYHLQYMQGDIFGLKVNPLAN